MIQKRNGNMQKLKKIKEQIQTRIERNRHWYGKTTIWYGRVI